MQPALMEQSQHFIRHHMFSYVTSGMMPTRILRYWAKGYDYQTGEQKDRTMELIFERAYRQFMFDKGEYKFQKKVSEEQLNKMALSGRWIVKMDEKTGKIYLTNRDRQPALYIEPGEYERLKKTFGIYA